MASYWTDGRTFADLADVVLAVARELEVDGIVRDPAIERLASSEIRVLRWVRLHGPCSPSAIADGTRMQRSNLSTSLRRLEALGFVRRDGSGGRGVLVSHTPLADEHLDQVRADFEDRIVTALGPDDEAEVAAVVRLLRRLEQALDDQRAAERGASAG